MVRALVLPFAVALVFALIGPAHADFCYYSYDAGGRLISVTYSVGSGMTTITYTYDNAGNRQQQSVICTGATC